MKVINTRNVHQVLPFALQMLFAEGVRRDSRNGPVLQFPTPVTTVYHRPSERVLFWPLRDANPFFHLYEALWMLRGRNDVAGVARYAGNMKNYSDDDVTLHGAYGHRWRKHFRNFENGLFKDQLSQIAAMLRSNPDDRRAVLQMWDAEADLNRTGKDVPCNTIATFQVSTGGELDLHVFCRSNDIVWGAYGANAVHFSFLLEYMCVWTGLPMGKLYQISVNWHGYLEVIKKYEPMVVVHEDEVDPYKAGTAYAPQLSYGAPIEEVDRRIDEVLMHADTGFNLPCAPFEDDPFFSTAYIVLRAHHIHKLQGPVAALDSLAAADESADWTIAAKEWFERRIK